jgi:transcriptional regulator with XRE-family HTH domain
MITTEMVESKSKFKESEGRERLIRWLGEHRVSKHAFAKRVDVSQQAVTGWLDGLTRPDDESRAFIHLVTGIEPGAWRLPEDDERVAARRAKVEAEALRVLARRVAS